VKKTLENFITCLVHYFSVSLPRKTFIINKIVKN
jgi:hypothetical protein